MLNAVTNERIEFVTTPDESAPLPVAGRRVIVTGPSEAVRLSNLGDVRVLPELAQLLRDPQRAWAAEVMLAALTQNEANVVNAFATHPEQWQESVGQNAYERWSTWLEARKGKLSWDKEANVFVQQQ